MLSPRHSCLVLVAAVASVSPVWAQCPEPTCSGNGTCIDDACVCEDGWSGDACECPTCPDDCSGNGVCDCGTCICDPGAIMPNCSCVPGPCPDDCSGNGVCSCGACVCDADWGGDDCTVACAGGCVNGQCDATGTCQCAPGWAGATCADPLPFDSGLTRVFLAPDGQELDVAPQGMATIVMSPGERRKISVWTQDSPGGDRPLNSYQVIMWWDSTPQPGATGLVSYVNETLTGDLRCDPIPCDPTFPGSCNGQLEFCEPFSQVLGFACILDGPCDPEDPEACFGFPQACRPEQIPSAHSVIVDTERPDFVFAGLDFNPPLYNESPGAPPTGTPGRAGFGFVGSRAFLTSGEEFPHVSYLGEFVIEAGPDAWGEHLFEIVPEGQWPGGGTDFYCGGGICSCCTETLHPLRIIVTQCGDGLCFGEETLASCPQDCECETAAECCDLDGNAIRDDNCAWCPCDGLCQLPIATTYADLGGAFSDCEPDGFANVHDRNHVLECFGSATDCDPFNIDAGGPFGACAPDGFCNLHDVTHVLNVFAGVNTCSCGPAPAIVPQPTIGGRVALRLVVDGPAHPGRAITVRVVSDGPLPALQGYQFELEVSGGRRGQLRLVDIEPGAGGFDGSFSAVNLDRGQMLQAFDPPQSPRARDGVLATYKFHVPPDARGTFVVGVASGHQRTALVGAGTTRITIEDVQPAVIPIVTAARRQDARR